jgi:hypothetical protein
MPLYRDNGVLVAKNNALAVGAPCCCSPFEPGSCNDCCQFPPEIAVNINLNASKFYVSMRGIFTSTGPVNYSGSVILRKLATTQPGRCAVYVFNSCGDFGNFYFLGVDVTFFFTNGICLASALVGVEARGCFGGEGYETTISTHSIQQTSGGCCAGIYNGGFGYQIFGDLQNVENIDGNFLKSQTFPQPCQWSYSCSGVRRIELGASQVDFANGLGKFRTESDCECDSFAAGTFLRTSGFHDIEYTLSITRI